MSHRNATTTGTVASTISPDSQSVIPMTTTNIGGTRQVSTSWGR
jgi:hypothetical protein